MMSIGQFRNNLSLIRLASRSWGSGSVWGGRGDVETQLRSSRLE